MTEEAPRTNRAGLAHEIGPTEYARQLTDPELIALGMATAQRMAALLGQGVPLPVGEIDAHHMIGLLEAIAGPDVSLRVSEWHLTWLDRQLDQTEAAVRARLIESGVFDGAPTYSPAP